MRLGWDGYGCGVGSAVVGDGDGGLAIGVSMLGLVGLGLGGLGLSGMVELGLAWWIVWLLDSGPVMLGDGSGGIIGRTGESSAWSGGGLANGKIVS